ncbi:MAG: hypothetical protein FWG83_04305 [Oscillospiraceae bacterium]|nr:hypothetical protein [Oscillospiraceae bacterium]
MIRLVVRVLLGTLAVFFLICFPPIGIIIMCLFMRWNRKVKIVLSVLSFVFIRNIQFVFPDYIGFGWFIIENVALFGGIALTVFFIEPQRK